MLLEKDFEEIICKYPELVEEGLVLKDRQLTLYGRRIDILFEDKFGRELIIELKVGPIKDEHIGQLLSYEGMRLSGENPDVRVMLIGNRVPPNIQRSLDHHGIAWKEITIMQLKDFLIRMQNEKFLDLLPIDGGTAVRKEKVNNSLNTVKVIEESSGVWVFQANRKYYRFFDLIRDENFNKEWWHIDKRQKKIQNQTKEGNTILFWLTDKRAGSKDAGIYAMGEVIVGPKTITRDDCVIDYCTPEFYKKFPDENFSCYYFQCRLIKEFIDKPILKEHLRDNPILKDTSVIKTRGRGTNFKVTKEQWLELKRFYPILS